MSQPRQPSPEPDGMGGVGGPEPDGIGPLGTLALARGEVDRATMLREDTAWLAAAWADPGSRVLVLRDGQALVRFGEDGAELVLVPPAAAPEGVRFLLGTDADGVAYFGVGAASRRRPDAPDTQACGARLWPFSTLGWPDETPELERYYPTSVLVTGFDIIFFWVARMMMMGMHLMKEVPFHNVYIHALVRDEKGAKMSKSKGNVVDPLTSWRITARTRCASPWRQWRRKAATSSCRCSALRAIATSRRSFGTRRASAK